MSEELTAVDSHKSQARLKVFISYSRIDQAFAEELLAGLEVCGFEAYLDKHDIAPGEAWEARINRLILEADTVVYVISPNAVASDRCAWEIAETERLAKRILPVVWRAVDEKTVPDRLKRLNYIFFDKPNAFGGALRQLVDALKTDLSWLRHHTRLLEEATGWDERGRVEAMLLRGETLAEAKAWLAGRPKNTPEPTEIQRAYIIASDEAQAARESKERQQLEVMAAAQTERETALVRAEEALKVAADAQIKKVRVRNIALAVVSGMAVVAGGLGWVAMQQRDLAVVANKIADEFLEGATKIIVRNEAKFDGETKKEVFSVFRVGAEHGNARAMNNLAWTYSAGYGVLQDKVQARKWLEKSAALHFPHALASLGKIYSKGQDVVKDDVKARELLSRGVAGGDPRAMIYLGEMYADGKGGERDNAKACALAEKALAIVEAGDLNRLGRPGKDTANFLSNLVDFYILASDFTKAVATSERAHKLMPDDLGVEINRAHALMFVGQVDEARLLYKTHRGEYLFGDSKWELGVVEDFIKFRKNGLSHPLMDEVEKEFSGSP